MFDTVCFYLGLVVVIQGCFCRIDRWNLHNKLLVGNGMLKEEGRGKKEEGRRKKEEGRGKKEEGRGEKISPYIASVLLLSKVISPKF